MQYQKWNRIPISICRIRAINILEAMDSNLMMSNCRLMNIIVWLFSYSIRNSFRGKCTLNKYKALVLFATSRIFPMFGYGAVFAWKTQEDAIVWIKTGNFCKLSFRNNVAPLNRFAKQYSEFYCLIWCKWHQKELSKQKFQTLWQIPLNNRLHFARWHAFLKLSLFQKWF